MKFASRGTREDDEGRRTPIEDAELADALRRQGTRIHAQSAIAALLVTGALLLLPL